MCASLNPLLDHFQDLYAPMAWADACFFGQWARSGLQQDPGLLQRMQHTTDVQGAFLMVLRGEAVQFPGEPDPVYPRLRELTRGHHRAFAELLGALAPADLARTVPVPWFPGRPCQVTVAEALTQVAMHTQHHRGQLMARLKDLGGQPQNVDFIIWAWQQRPQAQW